MTALSDSQKALTQAIEKFADKINPMDSGITNIERDVLELKFVRTALLNAVVLSGQSVRAQGHNSNRNTFCAVTLTRQNLPTN